VNKFQIGEEIEFYLYSQLLKGTIQQPGKGGFYIKTTKKDVSRKMIPVTLFVKTDKIKKIVLKEEE
jgi:hypothetical protein